MIGPDQKSPAEEEGIQTGEQEGEAGEFSDSLIAVLDPMNVAVEAYRTLRTNLFYTLVDDPPKVIMFTSPGPREGKSATCANLGVVLAEVDKSTLILDCDLRRPTMHKIFGLRNFRGIMNVLTKDRDPHEVWQESLPNLKVLTTGHVPLNPAELLGSRRFTEFLGWAREEFDYVLIDAPPVEVVSDPVVLATQADGVLLVVDAHGTSKRSVQRSLQSLEAVEARVLGTVMNNVDASKGNFARYGSYTYS